MLAWACEPISSSNESPSEWAGSVRHHERALARTGAERTAVAAATVVLPTPPFPVNRRTRIASAYGGWAPPWRPPDAGRLLAHLDAALELL